MAVRVIVLIVVLCAISAQEYGDQDNENMTYGPESEVSRPPLRAYTFPRPKLIAFWPRGLKIVMKDDGFSRVIFHGNVNKRISPPEAGQWSQEFRKNNNGKWVIRDNNAQLNVGDSIFFWTFIVKNGVAYQQINGQLPVIKYNENEAPAAGQANFPAQTNPPTEILTMAPTPQTESPTQAPCTPSPTVVMGQNPFCKQALIFSEEFNGNTVKDLTKWQAESKFLGEPDYPFNLYMTESAGIMKFEEGALVITPVLLENYKYEGFIHESLDLSNRCTGQAATTECKREASGASILPPVITGKVTTRNKFNFKFGRVEVRAKLPAGSWLVPEINLEPLQNIYGNHRYESGLMRVAFAKGNDAFAKKLYGGPVLSDTDPYRTLLLRTKIGIENWNQDFHNYSLIWKPDSLELLVDGERYGTVLPGEGFHESAKQHAVPHAGNWLKGTVMAPLDQMFYLSLGLRVGGINDFEDALDKPWRNKGNKATVSFYNAKDEWQPTWYDPTLKVDYVRVYAL